MLSILAFIFGASVGSFVQVIASRLHVAPIMKGRSKCLSCGEALRPYDLIPVFSYLFLKGKCRYCKSKYGISSLITEIIYGVTFLLVYLLFITAEMSLLVSALWLLYYTMLFIVLGVMALYDKVHSYIPTSLLVAFLVLTGVKFFLRVVPDHTLLSLLSPLLVALLFFVIWLVTKGRGLGFGDVILFFGVGAFFGSLQGFAVLVISVWLGALVGVYYKYVILKKKNTMVAIPFVPFIVIAFLVVLFTDINIFSIAMSFS